MEVISHFPAYFSDARAALAARIKAAQMTGIVALFLILPRSTLVP
jgi:hypothetical protein